MSEDPFDKIKAERVEQAARKAEQNSKEGKKSFSALADKIKKRKEEKILEHNNARVPTHSRIQDHRVESLGFFDLAIKIVESLKSEATPTVKGDYLAIPNHYDLEERQVEAVANIINYAITRQPDYDIEKGLLNVNIAHNNDNSLAGFVVSKDWQDDKLVNPKEIIDSLNKYKSLILNNWKEEATSTPLGNEKFATYNKFFKPEDLGLTNDLKNEFILNKFNNAIGIIKNPLMKYHNVADCNFSIKVGEALYSKEDKSTTMVKLVASEEMGIVLARENANFTQPSRGGGRG